MQQTSIHSIPGSWRRHHAFTAVGRLVPFLPALCALVLVFASARSARAQVWIDTSQLNGKLPDWVDPAYVNPAPDRHDSIRIAPIYRTVVRHCWCEPIYRTVCRRVWHEPVVRDSWDRTWVPPRYEWRECCCDGHVGRELILAEPGHYEMCRRQVVISPGFWETVEVRELVSEGHYENRIEVVGNEVVE